MGGIFALQVVPTQLHVPGKVPEKGLAQLFCALCADSLALEKRSEHRSLWQQSHFRIEKHTDRLAYLRSKLCRENLYEAE